MSGPQELSPRAALVLGLVVIAVGVAPILGALQILPLHLTKGTPVWVGVCAGGLFVLGGLALMNGPGVANSGARSRLQTLLGVAICGCLSSVAGWVAFGPGRREFTTTVTLPFLASRGYGNEWLGRAVFGLGSILVGAMGIAFLVIGFSKKK